MNLSLLQSMLEKVLFRVSLFGFIIDDYSLVIPQDITLHKGGSEVPYVIVRYEGFPMKHIDLKSHQRIFTHCNSEVEGMQYNSMWSLILRLSYI